MFSQKRRIIALVIGLGIVLTSISASTSPVDHPILRRDNYQLSSVVWSDDFENVTKTLSEWTIVGFDRYHRDPYPPNITLSDGLLYFNGPEINLLTHNSTTVTGTWNVDIFQGESDYYYTMIFFMSPQWYDFSNTLKGYVLVIEPFEYILGYMQDDLAGAVLYTLDEATITRTTEWRHIDITRQSDDMMYVYIDGELLLQSEDTRLHSSEYFRLWAHNHTVFDNVTVSDTVDIDRVPPHWTEPLINHSINIGDDFSYALSADDYSGLDSWWVNDSVDFAIDNEGVVSSVGLLPAGNHSVEIYVNDTFGNVLSGSFNIEVIPLSTDTTTTGPNPPSPLTITLFGAAGVAWVAAVIFIFNDYRRRSKAHN